MNFDEPFLLASNVLDPDNNKGITTRCSSGGSGTRILKTRTGDSISFSSPQDGASSAAIPLPRRSPISGPALLIPTAKGLKLSLPAFANEIWYWHLPDIKADDIISTQPVRKIHKVDARPIALQVMKSHADILFYLLTDGSLTCSRCEDSLEILNTVELPPIPADHVTRLEQLSLPGGKDYILIISLPRPKSNEDATAGKKKARRNSTSEKQASVSIHFVSVSMQLDIALAKTLVLSETGIADVAFTKSGHIITLSTSGSLRLHRLSTSLDIEDTKTIQLRSASFTIPQHLSASPNILLSLSDSYFFLALQRHAASEQLDISIWDARHGLCCLSTTLKLTTVHDRIVLDRSADDLITITQTTNKDDRIHALPCVVPSRSQLSQTLGKSSLQQQYVEVLTSASPSSGTADLEINAALVSNEAKSQLASQLAELRRQCLQDLSISRQSSTSTASIDDIFEAFITACVERLKDHQKSQRKQHPENVDMTDAHAQPNRDARRKAKIQVHKRKGLNPPLPSHFVCTLLPLLLEQIDAAPKSLRYLLERGLLSSSMCAPSLARLLYERKQLALLNLALQHLTDISEENLVYILKAQLADSPSEIHRLLAAVVNSSYTSSSLKDILRQTVSCAELKSVFTTLTRWLNYWNDASLETVGLANVPEIGKIERFIACLVDAYFVSMLQETALHPALVQLATALQQITTTNEELSTLDGALRNLRLETERAQLEEDQTSSNEDFIGQYRIETIVV